MGLMQTLLLRPGSSRLCPRLERLQGADQTVLDAGEAIIIRTPTGGGYGPAPRT
jgi:N-methylhydantoinase B/oxoprolinase/acetone carboxylase alpha subunit